MGISQHTPPPPGREPPSIDDLTDALGSVMRKGLPVSPERAPSVLLALRGVYARSINPDDYLSRVKALNRLLKQILEGLGDGEEATALRTIFATESKDRGVTLTVRRERAAETMNYGATHFRKRIEPKLLRDLAWFLHEDSQNYTPRRREAPDKMEISGDTPSLSPADVNEHEELVSRIWALVYRLRAELIRKARVEARPDASPSELVDVEEESLLVLGHLLNRIHEYIDAYGESILHGDAEFRVESLIRLAGWTGELSQKEAQMWRFRAASKTLTRVANIDTSGSGD